MKTLNEVMEDMSTLYDQVRTNQCDLKIASELANIAGKYLKAAQLELARDIFLKGHRPGEGDGANIIASPPIKPRRTPAKLQIER